MKKLVALLLALALALSMTTMALAEGTEKVTLHVLVTENILTKEPAELPYLQSMADAANVNIEWEVYTSFTDAYNEVKSVMLAGGDMPDVLLCNGSVSLSDLAQFPELFADLNTLLEYAPNISKILENDASIRAMSTNESGQILGLFQYLGRQPAISTRQLINKDWLDRLGLQIPTTWDELYEVLVAFKNNDANGNGDATDEIPMDWAPGIGFFNVLAKMSELGVPVDLSQGSGYYVEDGKVGNIFATEEYKELVNFLHKCYVEGLINENVFSQDYTTFQNYARAGRVGFTFGWDILDRIGTEHAAEYVSVSAMKPSADYVGETFWEYCFPSMNYRYPVGAISADCKNLDAAMRFVDMFYDPYYTIQGYWGTMGECIQDNGDGSYTVLDPADPAIDPSSWKWINSFADNSPMYVPDDMKIDLPYDMRQINEIDKAYTNDIANLGEDDKWPGPFMKYSAEQTTELSFYNVDLVSIYQNMFATLVTEGGVEEQWAEYTQRLQAAGLNEALAIYQAVYDAYVESLK